jgi:hypothetical protein
MLIGTLFVKEIIKDRSAAVIKDISHTIYFSSNKLIFPQEIVSQKWDAIS